MMSSSQMTTDVIEYPTLTLLVIVKSSAGPPVKKLSPWLFLLEIFLSGLFSWCRKYFHLPICRSWKTATSGSISRKATKPRHKNPTTLRNKSRPKHRNRRRKRPPTTSTSTSTSRPRTDPILFPESVRNLAFHDSVKKRDFERNNILLKKSFAALILKFLLVP